MSSSKSSPTNTTSTTTNTQETNLYQSGSGDLGIANSSGNSINITETDEGAVGDAAALGQSAIQSNTAVSLGAEGIATSALDALTQTQQGSFNLVENAINSANQTSQEAITMSGNLASTAQAAEASNESAALQTVASTSSTQFSNQEIIKYVLIAVAGLGGIAIVAFAFKRK